MEKFSDNNFQVINMNYKLKKIKNKKKSKNNYKNIETFETLDNIQTENKNKEKGPNLLEGFDDSEYDGIDNVNDNKQNTGASIGDKLTELINKIYNFFVKTNHVIAKKIAMALSKNKATEKDIFLIRQYIVWSESVLAASYVTYNMFFIMYCEKIDSETKLIDISRKRAEDYEKELSEKKSLFVFPMNIFLYFFKYSIYFTEIVNSFLTKNTESNEKKDVNYATIFLFIFAFLVIFFKYSAAFMKDFLINALKFQFVPSKDTKGVSMDGASMNSLKNTADSVNRLQPLITLFVFITIILLWGGDFIDMLNIKMDGLSKGGSVTDFCLFLLNRFIKLIMVVLFGAPMSILMFIFYIYIYAFGSIFYYKSFDIIETYNTISKINDLIKTRKNKDDIDKSSFMEMLGINYIMSIIDFLYSKLIMIAFIIIYIVSSFEYYKKISVGSGILKNGLIFINICLIVMFSSIIMQFYILETRKNNIVAQI
jgi:hypothetical protein